MKKLMMIAVLMMTALTVSAQPGENKMTLKPFVGVNFATLKPDNASKTKTGFTAGVEAEFGTTGNLSTSLGLAYSQMGAKMRPSSWTEDIKFNYDYLDLSILENYYLAQGFAVKAGVQGGLNIRKKVGDSTGSVNADDFFRVINMDTKVQSFDFGAVVGASYEFKGITLDARYYFGTAKVMKNYDDKNRVLTITLGYTFHL